MLFSKIVLCALFGSVLLMATTINAETKYIPPSGASVNQIHPEKRSYEYWLTNTFDCSGFKAKTSYQTVRCGNVALDVNGNVVKEMQPVFVRKYEYHTSYPQSVVKK